MKILIVSNLYPPNVQGGYELLCRDVVEALRLRGHQIEVLTTPALRLLGPFPEPAPKGRLAHLKIYRHNYQVTAAKIRQFRPEVIFLWSQLRLGSGPCRAAEACGVPAVYTWNDEHILGLRPRPWALTPRAVISAFLDRTLWRPLTWSGLRFRRALSISQRLASSLKSGGYPGQLQVVYQGVPLEPFPLKENAGSLQTPIRLLYVGQLHPYKGPHTVVEAVAQADFPIQLTIAGSGPLSYEKQLQELARPLADRVQFLGRVERQLLPQIYRDHDVFVFPSIWVEPYGLTQLEAMASGLPVVATLHGGHGEHLRDGSNCLAMQKEDSQSLLRALQRLRAEPELGTRLAQAGRQLVETELNFPDYVSRLEAVLTGSLTP